MRIILHYFRYWIIKEKKVNGAEMYACPLKIIFGKCQTSLGAKGGA